FITGNLSIPAVLYESSTVQKILKTLPIEAKVRLWGEEIYFSTPVFSELDDNATEEQEIGSIAYWPDGQAICIFFGVTPVSISDKPRAISPVNPIGKITGDITVLKQIKANSVIKMIISKKK
ncbi:cyclophilin-like fold protein, partial [Bacteroidota bacterium]